MANDIRCATTAVAFATGVKTAALIVILGAIAALADHAFRRPAGAHDVSDAAPAVTAPPSRAGVPEHAPDAFAVPETLRAGRACAKRARRRAF